MDLKGALLGKTVSADGRVNHSSTARTPHLKLFATTYATQIDRLTQEPLIQDGILDGAFVDLPYLVWFGAL